MSKFGQKSGASWTDTDLERFRELVQQNVPLRTIGVELGRSPDALRIKAKEVGLSLKPTKDKR